MLRQNTRSARALERRADGRQEMAPASIDYQRLYSYRFRNVEQSRRDTVWGAIAPAIWELLGKPQKLLDPAAGRCEFLRAAPASEKWGVDAVKHEQSAACPGMKLLVSEIMEADLPASYFDAVFVSNFLEHLHSPDEVSLFLKKMRKCIRPGGYIGVMGPNFRHCSSEYFDYADHWIILTERSAEEHLYSAGFEIREVYARFLPYSFTGRLPAYPALVRAYLRFRPAWRLLGKQFLLIAKRPATDVCLMLRQSTVGMHAQRNLNIK